MSGLSMVLHNLHRTCEDAQLEQLKLAVECLGISPRQLDKIKYISDAHKYLCCQQSTASQATPLLYVVLEEMDVQVQELSALKELTTAEQLDACRKRKEFGFAKMIIKLCNEFTQTDFEMFRNLCLAQFECRVNSDHCPTIVILFQKLIRARKVVYPGSVQVLSEILTGMHKESSLKYVQEYNSMIGNLSQATDSEEKGSLEDLSGPDVVDDDKDGPKATQLGAKCTSSVAQLGGQVPEAKLPFCVHTEQQSLISPSVAFLQHEHIPAGSSCPNRLWDISRISELKVHFMNPELLRAPNEVWKVGDEQLTAETILAWATRGWNNHKYPNYPRICKDPVQKMADSHIRVKFGTTGVCRSCVGRNAQNRQGDWTMYLNLYNINQKDQLSLVLHEFGHALGLEHEHQRSDVWEVLKSILVCMPETLGKDYAEYSKFPFEEGVNRCQTEYDPKSIMHYWFDIKWLLPKYQDLEKVRAMTDQQLSKQWRKVIEGVHLRNLSMAEEPSELDYKTLENTYQVKK